jgi:gliding motility-associated protein GldM
MKKQISIIILLIIPTFILGQPFQNDSTKIESYFNMNLVENSNADKFDFDQIEAKVIANSNMIMVGSEYNADVILVASNSKSQYPAIVNGRALPMKEGKGIYWERAHTAGLHKWGGIISVKEGNETTKYPFEAEYMAFDGFATISADAMNILYVGLDNPISISIIGYEQKDIIATIDNGIIERTNRGWIAKVSNPGKAVITASVRMKDSSVRPIGSHIYRIKEIPNPECLFGTLATGRHPASMLLSQSILQISIPNFPFEEIKLEVLGYTVTHVSKNSLPEVLNISGKVIPESIRNIIIKAKRGDKIIIDEILVQGLELTNLKPAPLILTVQ